MKIFEKKTESIFDFSKKLCEREDLMYIGLFLFRKRNQGKIFKIDFVNGNMRYLGHFVMPRD